MDVNEIFIKLSGKFGPVPNGLITEDDNAEFRVNIEGVPFIASWIKSEYLNNNDGTVDKVNTLKFHHAPESLYDYEPSFKLEKGHIIKKEEIAPGEPSEVPQSEPRADTPQLS